MPSLRGTGANLGWILRWDNPRLRHGAPPAAGTGQFAVFYCAVSPIAGATAADRGHAVCSRLEVDYWAEELRKLGMEEVTITPYIQNDPIYGWEA